MFASYKSVFLRDVFDDVDFCFRFHCVDISFRGKIRVLLFNLEILGVITYRSRFIPFGGS